MTNPVETVDDIWMISDKSYDVAEVDDFKDDNGVADDS